MKKILIALLLLSVVVIVSCGGVDTGGTGNTAHDGNTGDTGDTGNTGNNGDTEDTGDTGNTGTCEHGKVRNCVDFDSFERCVDGSWETIALKHKGLEWSCKSPDDVNWDNAISYCEGLGGRLPNIQELRMLIQNCPEVEYPRPDGQTEWCEIEDPDKLGDYHWTNACSGCHYYDINDKYSVLGDEDDFWSFSSRNTAWFVGFDGGYVSHSYKSHSYFARCVK